MFRRTRGTCTTSNKSATSWLAEETNSSLARSLSAAESSTKSGTVPNTTRPTPRRSHLSALLEACCLFRKEVYLSTSKPRAEKESITDILTLWLKSMGERESTKCYQLIHWYQIRISSLMILNYSKIIIFHVYKHF